MRPETREYLKVRRGPRFVTGTPGGDQITFFRSFRGGVRVMVEDGEDLAGHVLDRAETVRLRDWLTTYLDNHPAPAVPPTPPGTTVERSTSGDWMWGCDHRNCSIEFDPGRWFGTATGGFTSEQAARRGLDAHLSDVHPTQMGGWPDPDEPAP